MRLIGILLALAIVGILVAKNLKSTAQAPLSSPATQQRAQDAGVKLPDAAAAPRQTVQQAGQAAQDLMKQGMDENARRLENAEK